MNAKASRIVQVGLWAAVVGVGLVGALQVARNLSTSEEERPSATGRPRHPSWSPDGSSLVYSQGADNVDLWTVRPGSDPERLTTSQVDEIDPAWGPSGRIGYATSEDPATSVLQTVLERDGGAPIQVLHHDEHGTAPAWSADGRTLIYPCRGICAVDTTTFDVRPVLRIEGAPPTAVAVSGRHRIAFIAEGEVSTLRDGDRPTSVVSFDTALTGITWAPDGIRLAVTTGSELWSIDTTDGTTELLIRAPKSLANPAWSPLDYTIAVEDDEGISLVREGELIPLVTTPD